MSWHHKDCTGKCLACLIEALVKDAYGTQGLEFLLKNIGPDHYTSGDDEVGNRQGWYGD